MQYKEALRGAVAVTVTPVTKEYKPDYEELQRQTDWLCNSGITGLFPCSSTGEFVKFEQEEKIEILKTVAQQNRGRKKLIAGACGACAEEVLRYIKAAREYDYDACVVCPPYYYPQSQQDIIRFYRQIAKSADQMAIMMYHVPFFTTGLTLDTIQQLMHEEQIIGMKDSSANMKQIAHTNQIKPDGFLVYTGTDDCLFPALAAGCDGSMTALAGILPEWITAVYKKWQQGDLAGAGKAQRSVLLLLRLADSLPFPIGYKLLAKARGLKIGPAPETVAPEKATETILKMEEELQKLAEGGIVDESNDLAGL